jgi:hypothetical protein
MVFLEPRTLDLTKPEGVFLLLLVVPPIAAVYKVESR